MNYRNIPEFIFFICENGTFRQPKMGRWDDFSDDSDGFFDLGSAALRLDLMSSRKPIFDQIDLHLPFAHGSIYFSILSTRKYLGASFLVILSFEGSFEVRPLSSLIVDFQEIFKRNFR